MSRDLYRCVSNNMNSQDNEFCPLGGGGHAMGKISKGLDGKLLAFSPAVDNFLTYSLQKKHCVMFGN